MECHKCGAKEGDGGLLLLTEAGNYYYCDDCYEFVTAKFANGQSPSHETIHFNRILIPKGRAIEEGKIVWPPDDKCPNCGAIVCTFGDCSKRLDYTCLVCGHIGSKPGTDKGESA